MADPMVDLMDDPRPDTSILKEKDPFQGVDPFKGTPYIKNARKVIDLSEIDGIIDYLKPLGHTFCKAEDPMEGIDLMLEKQETIELKDKPYDACQRVELYKIRVPDEAERKLLTKIIVQYCQYPGSMCYDVVYDRSAIHSKYKDENFLLRGPNRPPSTSVDPVVWVYTEDLEVFGVDICKDDYPQDVILEQNYESRIERKHHFVINYLFEVITGSVEAYIDITLPDGFEIGGEISATTDFHKLTQRILASSTKFENPWSLDRSVLAMRVNEVLGLHFDFVVNGKMYKGEARIVVPEYASEISGECNIVPESEWNMMEKRGVKRKNVDRTRKYRMRLSDCKNKIPLQIKVRFESMSLKSLREARNKKSG